MTKRRLKQMWVPPKFRGFVYEKKAENPDKSLTEVLEDIVDDYEGKKRKPWNRL